jgi:hypothetical protein
MDTKFYFGVHNGTLKVYVVVGKERKNKVLSFFGDSYRIETSTEYFDKKQQAFLTRVNRKKNIPTAAKDNSILKDLMNTLEEFAASRTFDSPDDFFNSYKSAMEVEAKKGMTLLEFVRLYTQQLKNNVFGQEHDSTNWEKYNELGNKLEGKRYGKRQGWAEGIKYFADMDVNSINDKVFQKWAEFLISNKIPYNRNITQFKATVRAFHRIYNNADFILRLPKNLKDKYNKEKGTRTNQATILTKQQLNELFSVDLNKVCPKIPLQDKQLYLDVLKTMYDTLSRPCDILQMRIEDITIQDNKVLWDYAAKKIRNKVEGNFATMQDDTYQLILKHIGNKQKGYVWELMRKYEELNYTDLAKRTNQIEGKINELIHGIADFYNWKKGKYVMYSIRHISITHFVANNNVSDAAVIGHTSIREITRTYLNKNELVKSKDFKFNQLNN